MRHSPNGSQPIRHLPEWAGDADGFAVDLDGTLISDKTAMDGTVRLLEVLTGRFVIVSNNSSDTSQGMARKLKGLGLSVPPDRLLLAGEIALKRIARSDPGARVMLLASSPMARLARGLGLSIVSEAPDIVVLGRDPRFSYRKLCLAANALRSGARLVVTNPDLSHPGRDNRIVPETGALMQALTQASGIGPAEIVGKPYPALLEEALRRLATAAHRTIVIGDNPETDGAGAARLGMPCILLGKAQAMAPQTPADLLGWRMSPPLPEPLGAENRPTVRRV